MSDDQKDDTFTLKESREAFQKYMRGEDLTEKEWELVEARKAAIRTRLEGWKMTEQLIYLTTGELAKRWNISANTIRNWRFRGIGPRYFKPSPKGNGKALYALTDIVEWERSRTVGGEPE